MTQLELWVGQTAFLPTASLASPWADWNPLDVPLRKMCVRVCGFVCMHV